LSQSHHVIDGRKTSACHIPIGEKPKKKESRELPLKRKRHVWRKPKEREGIFIIGGEGKRRRRGKKTNSALRQDRMKRVWKR